MDRATVETSRASATSQSSSQPSHHLCQACLSMLTRDDLERDKNYPHHSSLNSFVKASQERCYVCSYVFSSLDVNDQENLRLLAAGKTPDEKSIEKNRFIYDDKSDFAERYPDPVERGARFCDLFGQTTAWVSFTMMRLAKWRLPGPSSSVVDYLRIQVRPNPLYEEYFPPRLKAYRSSLEWLWKNVAFQLQSRSPLIISQQEFTAIGLVRDLPSNTGSMETWATVEGWLQECSEQHDCLTNINKNWYPTRLVEGLSNGMFRVVRSDSSSFRPGRGYVTLSHRWGSGDFLRLTTTNLSALENGQPVTKLRRVFQEALVVAQRINIPYIWIDSLCIIQSGDDFADWRQESKTMAEVYCNSLCNISADWSDDSNGLFFERSPPFEKPCGLQLRPRHPETGDDILPEHITPPAGVPIYIMYHDSLVEDVMKSPLNRRGWVVQERLLAPRILHFSPHQVSWECGQKLTWERVPLNFMDPRRSIQLVAELDRNGRQRERMERLGLLRGPRGAVDWPRIVAHYSACDLTKQQDKLVAIAGIARRLCPVVEDRYVAGMWARSLPTGLLWRRSAPKERRCPPTEYFAPTFSWAASDGEVLVVHDSDFSESQIMASAVFIRHRMKPLPCSPTTNEARAVPGGDETLTDDIFGPLVSPEAEVRMRGPLRSCSRVPQHPAPYPQPLSPRACPSTGAGDPGIQLRLEDGTVLDVDNDRALDDDSAGTDPTVYYYTIIECSLVQPTPVEPGPQYRYSHATGLLLRSVDAGMGRFERVGRVYYFRARGAADILQPLGNERDLPAWSYDETKGEHTFYIV